MAKALQHRRGTTAEHGSFTGLEGEFTYDTTEKRIVAHDGSTAGGIPLAKKSEVDDARSVADAAVKTSGATMTGAFVRKGAFVNNSANNANLQINGGTGWGKGASIDLYGKDRTTDAGAFKVRTTDGTNTADFMVMPNGTAKIKGYPLEHVVSQGGGYIRYASGLQICYLGFSIPDGASSVVVSYPVAFSSVPAVSMGIAGSGSSFMYYKDTTTTSVTMNRTGTSGVFSGSCVAVGKWQ